MSQQDSKDSHRKPVGKWLSLPFEWRIPVYQRHYAWETGDSGPIHLFWNTVEEQTKMRLNGETPKQHYLGAVIVDDKTVRGVPDGITRYDVVDGQQRLTTIQIALLALAKVAEKGHRHSEIVEKLKQFVFYHEDHPRLRPTNFDNKQFQTVLSDAMGSVVDFGGQRVSSQHAEQSKIVATCRFFEFEFSKTLKAHSQHGGYEVLDAILATLLNGFDLVLIVLLEDDDAQGIFESLNSYAKPLTTFDLIRNNVFRRAAKDEIGLDEQLFNSEGWQKFEEPYWEGKADNRKSDGSTHIEAYIARMLVAVMKEEILFNRSEIFKTYKKFSERFHPDPEVEKAPERYKKEIKALGYYAGVYRHLDGVEGDSLLSGVNLGIFSYPLWKNRDFYPVIFSIAGSDASMAEKARMIKLLESYVIRRGVCDLSTAHYNKFAVTICKAFAEKGVNCETLSQTLKSSPADTTVFPNDERVAKGCIAAKFRKSVFQHYVFEKLELFTQGHDPHHSTLDVQSIHHVLPEKWEDIPGWTDMLKETEIDGLDGAQRMVPVYIDTIGNLAPMSTKGSLKKANRSWKECKKLLEQSSMTLNNELTRYDTWGTAEIRARSQEFAERICEIWPYDIS